MLSAIVTLIQSADGAFKRNMLSSLAQRAQTLDLEDQSQMIQSDPLWSLGLLSSAYQNCASWLQQHLNTLESDQKVVVSISAIDLNGMESTADQLCSWQDC